MTPRLALFLAGLLMTGILSLALLSVFRDGAVPQPDTVYTFVDRDAQARAETTRVTVTRFRDRIDSIIRTDTMRLHDTLFLRSLDTVFVNCLKCADQIDSLRHVIRNLRDTVAKRDRALAACGRQKPLWAAGGAIAAALVCR
jgi:hypothetical protein